MKRLAVNFEQMGSHRSLSLRNCWLHEATTVEVRGNMDLDRIIAGLIIAHPEMLDFDYVPDELVGREEIQRELASKFPT